MSLLKIFLIVIASLISCAYSLHLPDEQRKLDLVLENIENMAIQVSEDPVTFKQSSVLRERRQAPDMNTNPFRASYTGINIPENNIKLSAIGSTGRDDDIGLNFKDIIDRAATWTRKFIPKLANQLTVGGKAKIFHKDKHDITAEAFATRNFPNNPIIPNYNTFGGKLGYTYDNKIGGSLGLAHTDLFKKTDYSAMSNLNILKDPTSTVNLNAGFRKSTSPFMPGNRWKPSVGLSFSKFFDFFKEIF